MRIQKIYIDTSVLGGYFDTEFEIATRELFDQVKNGYHSIEIRSPKDLADYENE